MKVSLKFCRCSLVLLLALTVAFLAAVGVSAESLTSYDGYNNVYKDSQGVIILSKTDLNVIPLRNGSTKLTDLSQAQCLGFVATGKEPLLLFIPQYYNNNITYKLYIVRYGSSTSGYITYNTNNEIETGKPSSSIASFEGSYSLGRFNAYFWFDNPQGMDATSFFNSYSYKSNNIVYDNFNNNSNNLIPNGTINSDYDIDDAIGSNGLNINDIISAIDTALNNNQTIISIENNIEILLEYGNSYDQIDQNTINNLGSAEDQLSSAEGALEDKSQSLKDSVASQWSNIQSTSKTFITNLAPAAAAVGTVTTQFLDAAPEEVKGLFVTIPLLIFIGWLIGRIRGD